MDAFLQAYDLGSDEGIALMCLAEALLRIPDAETADELIADKLSGPNWAEKLGESSSHLRQCRDLFAAADRQGARGRQGPIGQVDAPPRASRRPSRRAGDPHCGQPGDENPGPQFVFGRTIDEALKRAAPEQRQGLSHSFDMLGEAAQDPCGCRPLCRAYAARSIASPRKRKTDFASRPGFRSSCRRCIRATNGAISRKPERPCCRSLRDLAMKASKADVHFTIDAEEADRLEPSWT